MKLNEAIMVGSTVVKGQPHSFYSCSEQVGCALGMAAVGAGLTFEIGGTTDARSTIRTGNAECFFPVLLQTEDRPCNCWLKPRMFYRRLPKRMLVRDIVTHLFDEHVFGKKDWTLEELSYWVASVEQESDSLDELREDARLMNAS